MIRILRYGEVVNAEIFSRSEELPDVSEAVRGIIDNVRNNGDSAIREYGHRFDGYAPEDLEVSKDEIEKAIEEVGPEFIEVLERSAANIRRYHSMQKRDGFEIRDPDGTVLGQKIIPIEKVGLYIPGGTAAYPSTVLMNAIPAKIAGCREIVMVSPPTGGSIDPAILAAASIAGVDRIFKTGGAQAVAALAYGTESIPKVDKIVGPGNVYVAEAKRQVFGQVAIDMIAGPSEILVVADGKAVPREVAADMISQAEHDTNASAVLVTDSMELALKVKEELEKQSDALPRKEIIRTSLRNNGKIIVADDIYKAVEVANEIAPEHLELYVEDPFTLLKEVKNAGSVFLGRYCPEALGDYFAGPNHTLPTGGTARFSSALSVDDFIKKTQYISYTEEALKEASGYVYDFAMKEGLMGHARSAVIRFEGEDEK